MLIGMFVRTGEIIYWNELTDSPSSLFDMNFTTSQTKNDVTKLPWWRWQVPLKWLWLRSNFCCSALINGYYMMFSDMGFGFGYLLLWRYSCLPLIFLPVYYTSALFEIQKSNWRIVIEKYVRWFVLWFILHVQFG